MPSGSVKPIPRSKKPNDLNKTLSNFLGGVERGGQLRPTPSCLDRKSTPEKTLSTRSKLLGDLKVALEAAKRGDLVGSGNITRIAGLLGQVDKTYPTRQGAVRPEVWNGYFTSAFALITINRARDGVEAVVKGLEAHGYDIVAYPLQSSGKNLEVKRWGYVHTMIIRAFLLLEEAYRTISPPLRSQAKHYARIAYRIYTRTDLGVCDIFPQLA